MSEPIRIANCSGFYGDRLSAAAEMVNDGPIDVLTGDWLAELTMLILARTQTKSPGSGYAKSFVSGVASGGVRKKKIFLRVDEIEQRLLAAVQIDAAHGNGDDLSATGLKGSSGLGAILIFSRANNEAGAE